MASYLRPRRGKRSTANSTLTGTAALKNGEIFFEYQNGNSAGGGVGGIKMGNGSTTYSSLPYFVNDMNNDNATLGFTNSTASSSSADSTLLGNIIPSNNLKTVLTNIKQLLWNHSAMIAKLNSDMYEISWEPTSSSTLLTLFNQYRGTHSFPISIAKSGQTSITDLPASYKQSEFTCIIVGNVERATAICMVYNTTLQIILFRQLFHGEWRSTGWTKITTSDV